MEWQVITEWHRNYFTAILSLGGLEQEGAVVTATIGLFLTELPLFAITLLASGLKKTYKRAVRISVVILLLFYVISITAEYLEAPVLYYLTLLKYFDVYIVATGRIYISFFCWLWSLLSVLLP